MEVFTAVLFLTKESLSLFFFPLIRMALLLHRVEPLVLILTVCVCVRERERERERERDNLIKSKSQGVCLYGQTLRPYISHTGVCVCMREREREREREGVHNGLDYYYYFRLIKEIYEDCIIRMNTCMNYYQNILANIKISKIFLYVLIRILANIKISKIFLYMHELLSNFLFHHFQFNKAMFCLEP